MRHDLNLIMAASRTALAQALAHGPLETKGEGEGDPDVAAQVLKLAEDFEKKSAGWEEAKGLKDEVKALRTEIAALKRPGAGEGGDEEKAVKAAETKSFTTFVRFGEAALGAEELKTLRVADNEAGGYLAPDQFVAELDRNLVLISPIRNAARVTQTSAGAVTLPKRLTNIGAQWVDEIEERPEDEPTYGQTTITVREMAVSIPVSNKLLEDSAIDIAAELSFDFAEAFGQAEGAAFVNGDGIKRPLGLLNGPIATVLSGNATGVPSADPLIDLLYKLAGIYASRAAWGMNRSAMGVLRKLKDSTGNYIWAQPLTADQPPLLLGRPVIEMPDLPDIAAGSTPIVVGDFTQYRIVDRTSLSVLRDPYSQAKFGKTVFHARKRVGGAPTKPEAFRFLKIAAS